MLQQLVINDLAVIDKLDLDFKPGMTVFTGETGAGKSILLDAIGLLLGDRADSALIRSNSEKTDVTAVFSLCDTPAVKQQLAEMGIDIDDEELFIRRVINKDGRSRAYLNNSPVPVQTLKDIGDNLIDIYGQHAHQSLSKPTSQRQILDEFGNHHELVAAVATTYTEWKDVKNKLQLLQQGGEDYEARLTLLRYQVDELSQLAIADDEYAELNNTHKRLAHSRQLVETCQSALDELSSDDISIMDRIGMHQGRLDDMQKFDSSIQNISELLNNALIQIEEAVSELRHYIDSADTDSENLAQMEKRLDQLHDLARKHHVKPESLPEHFRKLQEDLDKLEHGQEHHDALQKQLKQLEQSYIDKALLLGKQRHKAAKKLSAAITEKMHELGMGGEFKVAVESIDDTRPRQYGLDSISFLVSTNPGQPLRPLNKVASGGELSRLSLAIQIIGTRDSSVATLIFDEVDTGISGGIAEVVGRMLHKLAEQRQVFCVTHLAQVASCGHHHCRVSKQTDKEQTRTQVQVLDREERIDEVARMLAGIKITSESRANAEKMLDIA